MPSRPELKTHHTFLGFADRLRFETNDEVARQSDQTRSSFWRRKDLRMYSIAKKLLMITVAALLSPGFCHAQGLEPGNLIGVHVVTVTLNANATMDDFINFYVREVLPEYEKNWPGLKGYLLKSFFPDGRTSSRLSGFSKPLRIATAISTRMAPPTNWKRPRYKRSSRSRTS